MKSPTAERRVEATQAGLHAIQETGLVRHIDSKNLAHYAINQNWIGSIESGYSYEQRRGKIRFPALGGELSSAVSQRLRHLVHMDGLATPTEQMMLSGEFERHFLRHLRQNDESRIEDYHALAAVEVSDAYQQLHLKDERRLRASALDELWHESKNIWKGTQADDLFVEGVYGKYQEQNDAERAVKLREQLVGKLKWMQISNE